MYLTSIKISRFYQTPDTSFLEAGCLSHKLPVRLDKAPTKTENKPESLVASQRKATDLMIKSSLEMLKKVN